MTYGGHFGKKAKGAINRFYEHADTRTIAALQELVSDLAVADPAGKDAAKKWAKAAELLAKTKLNPTQIARAVDAKNIKALAELVATLSK